MCIVVLSIEHPWSANNPTTGCTSNLVSLAQIPNGKSVSIHPISTQYAIMPIVARENAIGTPSKYLLFPDSSLGIKETVTLNRARRVRPQRTKKDRKRWSTGVCTPIATAMTAGAMPKDNCNFGEPYTSEIHIKLEGNGSGHTISARVSSCMPMDDELFVHRATLPSIMSKTRPSGTRAMAQYRFRTSLRLLRQYWKEENTDMMPQNAVFVISGTAPSDD